MATSRVKLLQRDSRAQLSRNLIVPQQRVMLQKRRWTRTPIQTAGNDRKPHRHLLHSLQRTVYPISIGRNNYKKRRNRPGMGTRQQIRIRSV